MPPGKHERRKGKNRQSLSSILAKSSHSRNLNEQMLSMVNSRNSLISNRHRLESLSLEFFQKAKEALEAGDKDLAAEALGIKKLQEQASHDLLLHVDAEKESLREISFNLSKYGGTMEGMSSNFLRSKSDHFLGTKLVPQFVPKTSDLKFSYPVERGSGDQLINSWVKAFGNEGKNYESFALYAESKLQEAIFFGHKNQGGDRGKIDPGIPAVCCDLMIKMGKSVFGLRFAPLLKLLTTQILRCIYCINGDPTADISEEELEKVNIRWLFTQKPWFASHAEVLKERDELKATVNFEAQGKDMKKALDGRNAGINLMFNNQKRWIRKVVFRTWKQWCTQEKARRNKFFRHRKSVWLRKWKKFIFAGGGQVEGRVGDSVGINAEERTWQKRFRAQEKEKVMMKKQIEELKSQLHHSQLELGFAYEALHELQPNLDQNFMGGQNAAEKKTSAMRKAITNPPKNKNSSTLSFESVSNIARDAVHWKRKVRQRMTVHDAEMTVFARASKIVHHSVKTQTGRHDVGGKRNRHKSILREEGRLKIVKRGKVMADYMNFQEFTKVPKTNLSHALALVIGIIRYACNHYEDEEIAAYLGGHYLTFAELSMDFLVIKFGIKTLANKHFKGLCLISKEEESLDLLFKIFNELIGVSSSFFIEIDDGSRRSRRGTAERNSSNCNFFFFFFFFFTTTHHRYRPRAYACWSVLTRGSTSNYS